LGTALFRHCASTRPGRRLNPAWGIIALPACRAAHTRAQVGASPPRRPRPPQGELRRPGPARAATAAAGGRPSRPGWPSMSTSLFRTVRRRRSLLAERRGPAQGRRERGEGRVAMTQDELLYRFRLRRPCPPLVRRS
jgi:hypothetical protein